MAAFVDGAPCWADVMLPDLEAGKRFYGELFGWTFEGGEEKYGRYTQALLDGKRVAALAPKPDGRMPTVWNLYFAVQDAARAAAAIREAGGQVIMDPTQVGEFGAMLMAADPGGAVFCCWQPGSHPGFERQDVPGTYCWTEVYTREPEAVDAFYGKVFGFEMAGESLGQQPSSERGGPERAGPERAGPERADAAKAGESADLDDPDSDPDSDPDPDQTAPDQANPAPSVFDFKIWAPAGQPVDAEHAVGGRCVLDDSFPAELPAHFLTYFAVADCDAAVRRARQLGGRVSREPQDTPYGRFAIVIDDQGASFAVIDLAEED
ncbi:VOC family protein [Streptomyces sp. H27-D2]|uniref:VOC family protein n=1 Tax=Streptomyces sp. H27-D2 TaxID=3046304 RepID=UPI002DBBA6C9|nr:VOC family protein [Streptomyces sp. H27-D2]MEC4015348.1 VOC family protein [Streptomyces sp. H27-D2]